MPNSRGWGGARPNTGGKREGAGRLRQRIPLTLETARLLRKLVGVRNAEHPEAHYTPANLVEDLIYTEALARGIRQLSEDDQAP